MLLHYLGKLKIQTFCRHSADIEENANKQFLVASNFASFPTLTANKTFRDLLLIYFCDQFVAPETRHSRRRCSVCQQSTW